MKKYQISEALELENTAGGKAPSDIDRIALETGYEQIIIHRFKGSKKEIQWFTSRVRTCYEWLTKLRDVENNSIVLIQLPIRYNLNFEYIILRKLKVKKNLKYIGIVHDIEKIRVGSKREHFEKDYEFMLHDMDVLIVHNNRMKDFFINEGYPKEKLVNLEIFDYLGSKPCFYEYNGMVSIAGNLDSEKAKYLKDLSKITKVNFRLFGPNNQEAIIGDNIKYVGVFPPEKLADQIAGSFGLVWDGESVETCSGIMGEYLRYNNPHKLSLYLSSGIPVIVWAQSAEADFVEKNGVGLLVNSLFEMEDILSIMDQTKYAKLLKNIKNLSEKLSTGYHTKVALAESEWLVNKE